MKLNTKPLFPLNINNIPLLGRKSNLNATVRVRSVFSKIIDPFSSIKSYWILFLVFVIIYLFFYQGVYVKILAHRSYDDDLYFNLAGRIGSLSWLGGYYSILLSKMPGFAIFLIFSIATRLPYLIVVGVCYSIAIAFFLHCSMWLFSRA